LLVLRNGDKTLDSLLLDVEAPDRCETPEGCWSAVLDEDGNPDVFGEARGAF